jgi:dTDP-4-amino-4,6-dideoxygalactose transaminase
MAGIAAVAARHGLAVVEDACHALGGSGVGACAHSAMATFSLHPVKVVAAGEGGVVTTNDALLAERLARLRNHGMTRDPARLAVAEQAFDQGGAANPWYYEMPEVGLNYRLSDIHAALARSQLTKLDRFVARRRALAAAYDAALARLAPLVRPIARVPGQSPAWHLYVVHIDFARAGVSRAKAMATLRARGIGTQVHYLPVHRQPYYRALCGKLDLPGADAYYERALSLPLFPDMRDSDVERVVGALASALGLHR